MVNHNGISSLEIEGKELFFHSPIKKILVVDNTILVLLQRAGVIIDKEKESLLKNIYAFDNKGNQLWIIEELPPFHGRPSLITGLYTRENKVLAYVSYGVDFEINLEDGSLIHIPDQRPW